MEQILYRYNPWWESGFSVDEIELIDRPVKKAIIKDGLKNEQVIFITGLRRIGKTSILKLIIKHLIQNGIASPERILYVSLDDYLLLDYNILEILEAYRKAQHLKFSEHVYIFLDEVTYKDDYQVQIKNIVDHQNVKVFASSSSASVLKSKTPYLTGRHFTYEILPLDFDEYLQFKNLRYRKADQHLIEKQFHEFLTSGGIPAYVLNEDQEYLQQLVDDIIYKDIAAVHGISNIRKLKDFFLLLMERAGKQFSINKVARILAMSPDTSKRYLELFKDTYLVHTISRHGKTNERLLAQKKVYAADLGIRSNYTGNRDYGSLFENYCFLRLKQHSLHYLYDAGVEIDFIYKDNLVECKYHDEPLSAKQQKLFEDSKVVQKHILRNYKDIHALESL